MHDLTDAIDVRVGFGVDETGVAIAGVATDALGFQGVGGIALETQGHGEGVVAKFFYVVVDGLHAGFAGERGEWVGLGVEGLRRVGTAEIIVEVAVSGEEFFGACVVGLEVGIGEGPCGGDSALVM